MAKIKFDDREYDTDQLSDEVKKVLGSLQFTEVEIQRTQAKLAVLQTARTVYANTVKRELEKIK